MMEFPAIRMHLPQSLGVLAASKPRQPRLTDDCMTGEPSLEELLEEPIVQMLMARDRVDPTVLEELLTERFA
ncbi:hypothetical protein [Jiella marina]|uniref:hypothetical protein n=1 Tax=Jiella sp. LLJ827 TaxID=2917712 RepID=UPI002101BCE6|nr:hypothetical protein [Jiella sp. LLJ827]MCQ0987819.1 hypothetical protein [Jiella sp. LLJ827]